MNVLVACEESQRVCIAFREKGHNAYSCDIQPCSGGHPEWHIQGDVLKVLNPVWRDSLGFDNSDDWYGIEFYTCDGKLHQIDGCWDLIIAHPPCTYLTVTANRWLDTGKYGKSAWDRLNKRNEAISFFYKFVMADCERIAIENPLGIMSTAYKKADQIIQPYMFGDAAEKRTCLWLKGLQKLVPTNEVEPPPRKTFASSNSMPEWYVKLGNLPKKERSRLRSQTFPGIAKAMAEQWG